MKKPMTRAARRFEKLSAVDQGLYRPIAWSSLGHLIFILLFIFLPKFTPEASVSSHIISVQLVASTVQMQTPAPVVEQKETAQEVEPVAAPQQKAAVSTASKPKEAVSLAPKVIETKRSMKKQTYKRERLLESAIKNVEKRVEASETDPKQLALDKIRSELKGKEANADGEASETTAAGITGLTGEGKPTTGIQRIYESVVAVSIQRNWAFSEQMTGGQKNLYNLVAVTIQRNGTIEDVKFERKSGNSYFDESTYKAILKSSLPQIPEGIPGASITLHFRFIPEGLQ